MPTYEIGYEPGDRPGGTTICSFDANSKDLAVEALWDQAEREGLWVGEIRWVQETRWPQ